MNTDNYAIAAHSDRSTDAHEPSRRLRRWWGGVTTLLVAATVIEAVFAGAILSGVSWARPAHAATAAILIASTTTAGLVSVVALRRILHGPRLGLTLLSLVVVLILQAAIGKITAHGANLMWLHVPLGAALVGLAAHAAASARRLGGLVGAQSNR